MARKLTFGMDFDDTLTACPEVWAPFITAATLAGHRIFLVTARRDTPENRETIREWLELHGFELHFVLTNLRSKIDVCIERGIIVDIWIDDNPHALVHGH